jgi:hypothetical protein
MRRVSPYGIVAKGDLIAVKRTSGPIVAHCSILRVTNIEVDMTTWIELKRKYADELCAPVSFWHRNRLPLYGTLLWIGEVRKMEPLSINKTDRRGWVALGVRGV